MFNPRLEPRNVLATFAVALLLVLGACSSKNSREGELKGEVFIVTEGRQNIKLALVEVMAIPESEINAFVSNQQPLVASQQAELQKEYDHALQEEQVARRAHNEAQDRRMEARRKLDQQSQQLLKTPFGESPKYDEAVGNEAVKRADVAIRLEATETEKRQIREQAEARLKAFPTAEFFFHGLPTTSIKVTTNSNGEFSLILPTNGKFAIAAHSSRKVLNSMEQYYWLIWISLDGQPAKTIMLSNNNLMTADSSDSVIHVKAMAF